MAASDVYDDAELYDLLAPADVGENEFYAAEALRLGGPVLELACGTGRLTIPLARRGIGVTGLDLHPGMLARARAAAAEANVTVEFVESDMRSFSLPRRFGLIFIAYNSLLHLHDVADLRACFDAVRRHLRTGGRFILEIFNPSPAWNARRAGERRVVARFDHPRHGSVTVEHTLDCDRAAQVNRETWYWSSERERDFRVRPLHLRNIYPQELPLLLELSGLKLLQRYGDYDRTPFDRESFSQVCICGPASATS